MAPLITLYILGGCVAAAGVLFIVMIVFSALRTPQLPIPADAPPLKRIIRALTPPRPFATATANPRATAPSGTFDTEEATIPLRPQNAIALVVGPPSPPSLPSALSRTAETSFEQARRVAPQRTAPPALPGLPPAPPSLPARAAPPPVPVKRAPKAEAPSLPSIQRPAPPSFAAAPSLMPSRWSPEASSPGSFASSGSVRLPVYPTHRLRTLLRIFGGLVATATLASAVVIAQPSLLDPLCDEIEWFGSGTAVDLRERARDANAELVPCVEALADTPAITTKLSGR